MDRSDQQQIHEAREIDPMKEMDLSPNDYQFTRNWFRNRNLPTFREYVYPEFVGKPITYLEIGVFEGQSLCWMAERVLTHPNSKAVGIDPWLMTIKLDGAAMDAVWQRAAHNVSVWSQCRLVRGHSSEVLRLMKTKGYAGIERKSVDICMVDGNHWAPYVLDDAYQCLQLLKPGGWMLMDDVENDGRKWHHVKEGLDMFLSKYGRCVKQLWKHKYMVCLQKVV